MSGSIGTVPVGLYPDYGPGEEPEGDIVGFHEDLFPINIDYGSQGGPGFSTSIVENDAGGEERVSRWSSARRRYNAAYGVKSFEDLSILLSFYMARLGPAYGFCWKDWSDFTTGSKHYDPPSYDDVDIGVGDGTEVLFQLKKKYTSGLITRTRNLTKPVDGTVRVALDGVEQLSGWSVNNTTGQVLFTEAPAQDVVVSAGCEFYVPCRFERLDDEVLSISIDSFEEGGTEVPIVEIKDELEVEDEYYYGGAKDHGVISANVIISTQQGRVHTLQPAATGLKVRLPDTTPLPAGGPHFYIINQGGNAIEVESFLGASLMVIDAGKAATLVIALSGETKIWVAI